MQVVEIYNTIHGEFPNMGTSCTVLRLAGCNLRCEYCDSSFLSNLTFSKEEVEKIILTSDTPGLLITGGEPLLQKEAVKVLLNCPSISLKQVVIETNGTIDISDLSMTLSRPKIAMDWKLNISPEETFIANLELLRPLDCVKFVFWDKDSFDRSIEFFHSFKYHISNYIYWVWSPILPISPSSGYYVDKFIKHTKELGERALFQTQLHRALGIK